MQGKKEKVRGEEAKKEVVELRWGREEAWIRGRSNAGQETASRRGEPQLKEKRISKERVRKTY